MQQGATTLGESSQSNLPTCERCGGPKPRGRGYRLCLNCKTEAKQARVRKRTESKRKPCKRCGGDKGPRRVSIYCIPCAEEVAAHCKKCGHPLKSNHCKECERKPCIKCGEQKPAGFKSRYCPECRDLEEWKNKKKRRVLRSKPRFCVDCNARINNKNLKYCQSCRERRETRWCLDCKTRPSRGTYKKYCTVCYERSLFRIREYHATYQRRRWLTDEGYRQRTMEREKRNKANLSEAQKARQRELARMRYRMKKNLEPPSEKTYLRINGDGLNERLPVAPLIPYIKSFLDRHGEMEMLTHMSGVDSTALRRFINGQQGTVRLTDADNICIALDVLIQEVYGYDIRVGRRAELDIAA